MIRVATKNDLNEMNKIGLLIDLNFTNKNKLEERIDLDYVSIYVYEEDNIIKGFMEVENHFEVIDLINIAVKEEYQDNDIGTSLISYLIKNNKNKRIMLEVNEINRNALNFYKKNKFEEINRRENYYGKNAAIIMERST